jgi:hypothetical protein
VIVDDADELDLAGVAGLGVYREFVRKTGISPADVAVPVAWKARRDNPRAAPFRRSGSPFGSQRRG